MIFTALTSESFIEKAMLLILGALLTGILAPLIKAQMDRATFKRQKTFEADLARQSDVIKAQTQFLTEFSNHIWEYHKISQRVSYTRLSGNKEAYQRALQEYQQSLWESLHRIRSAIGAARWFCSDAAHEALSSWYEDWFVTLEARLRYLIEADADQHDWSEHHTRVHYEARERNYGLLRFLAENFGLHSFVESGSCSSESSGKRAKKRAKQSRHVA